MTLDQAKSKVLDMNNKTLENFVNQRIGNDSELANFARNEHFPCFLAFPIKSFGNSLVNLRFGLRASG
jgi:hypothetical protein